MGGISRRGFLGAATGAIAGFTLGRVGLHRVLPVAQDPALPSEDHRGLPVDRKAISICGGCAAGCSVRLRVYDGRLVGIKGNPLCPMGGGGLCARGASEVEAYYDPDRLLGPLERAGERGQDRWKQTTWNAALQKVATRLKALHAKGSGARVGCILSSGRGSNAALIERVLQGLGSPHLYHTDHLRDEAALALGALGFADERPHTYDLEHSDLILSFGSPLLEGWLSPTHVARCFGRGRRRADGRLKLIHVGSRLSPTAMRADKWVRCAPGTEPTVALAIAMSLVTDGLIDEAYAAAILGFNRPTAGEVLPDVTGGSAAVAATSDADEAREGFRQLLERSYTPHVAERRSGVPVVEVLALAREFARARAPVAIGEHTAASMGLFGLSAIQLLNVLKGRVGVDGGVVFLDPPPVAPLPGPSPSPTGRLDRPPVVPVAGTPIWRTLGALAEAGREPPFDVLFLEDGAALAGAAPGSPARALLAKIPLVVSLAGAADSSTEVADLVLPQASTFEQHLDVEVRPAGSFSALAVARPALPRLVDGRAPGEVLLELGRRVLDRGALPAKDARDAVERRLHGLASARRGMPYASDFRRSWLETLERGGWWAPAVRGEEAFRVAVYAAGGWIDPTQPPHVARPRGPFRIYAAAKVSEASLLPLPKGDPRDAFHREADDTALGSDMTSLALVPFPIGSFQGRGSPNRPSLLEAAAPHVYGAYRPWAELSPDDWKRFGLERGGRVRLTAGKTTVTLPALQTPGVRPGTIAVPWAPTAAGRGRYARAWGDAAERLGVEHQKALGICTVSGFRVQVEAAAEGAS